MKMNKPYIEIVRFDAEDVIATSGVINCTVNSLQTGDRVLHHNNRYGNYFVYDYSQNTTTPVAELTDKTLHHNGQDIQYTDDIIHPGSSSTDYSAYLYDGHGDWYWWDEAPDASHGDY